MYHFLKMVVYFSQTCTKVATRHNIHPASRGVAAHTAVVLRQLQGPEMGSEFVDLKIPP